MDLRVVSQKTRQCNDIALSLLLPDFIAKRFDWMRLVRQLHDRLNGFNEGGLIQRKVP